MDLQARARKTAQNYADYRTQNGIGFTQFSKAHIVDGEDTGSFSPPLWKSTDLPGGSPQHRHGQNQIDLSPTSRTRVIAQGQMELMEMLRNKPESYYELSLRDIVEESKNKVEDTPSQEESRDDGFDKENAMSRNESRKGTRQNSRKSYLNGSAHMTRSGSIDNSGFLLKMVYPASIRSKQKRRDNSSSAASSNSKVSPRPSLTDRPFKGLDKDWWKMFSGSGKVDHGIMESDSGSMKSRRSSSKNGRNRREDTRVGCWWFYRKKERQTGTPSR